MKKIILIVVVVVVVGIVWGSRKVDTSTPALISPSAPTPHPSGAPLGQGSWGERLGESYKDAVYVIEGQEVKLTDGATRYFGNEVFHDLNDDGREDVAFLVTHSPGGSGTFYYLVAALNTGEGYKGSAGFLLGDRIAPQSTNIDEGVGAEGRQRQNVIVVNYADRKPNEPFTTPPSVGKSVWLKLNPETMQFGEVAQDFEGESR